MEIVVLTSVNLMALTCVMSEMKVSMTYISQSSDFALYLEDDLMDEHQSLDNESI